jgi:prevent-host-death family protein
MTTLSSRQFNQDTGAAKKQAANGPVFITDRGRPTHVLVTVEHYKKLKDKRLTLAEALAHEPSADIEFDIPKLGDFGLRVPDFD